ncbi:MAG TPA: hypothetical protein VLH19_04375 [Patescibacteria group bacterium]|nr:hypothetical protein [Patescibacteria group bacterium]
MSDTLLPEGVLPFDDSTERELTQTESHPGSGVVKGIVHSANRRETDAEENDPFIKGVEAGRKTREEQSEKRKELQKEMFMNQIQNSRTFDELNSLFWNPNSVQKEAIQEFQANEDAQIELLGKIMKYEIRYNINSGVSNRTSEQIRNNRVQQLLALTKSYPAFRGLEVQASADEYARGLQDITKRP